MVTRWARRTYEMVVAVDASGRLAERPWALYRAYQRAAEELDAAWDRALATGADGLAVCLAGRYHDCVARMGRLEVHS